MKLTKQRLKEIIKEELEVVLTDDEAAELFGDQIIEAGGEWSSSLDPDREAIDLLYAEKKRLVEKIGEMSLSFEALSPESQEALEKGLWNPLISYINVIINRGRRARGEAEIGAAIDLEEAASTAAERDRARDARRREKNRKREADPTYQKAKVAYEKHLEKAKKGREEKEKKRKRNEAHT